MLLITSLLLASLSAALASSVTEASKHGLNGRSPNVRCGFAGLTEECWKSIDHVNSMRQNPSVVHRLLTRSDVLDILTAALTGSFAAGRGAGTRNAVAPTPYAVASGAAAASGSGTTTAAPPGAFSGPKSGADALAVSSTLAVFVANAVLLV
ncbi:hypothetical protein CspHIS471_0410680 [Cutaneotrichosporon sp. HIS471]|nr:hypothetical protein CspHIS471_0410680 [Cutaneotrichosporon sp. HIS471]